MLRFGLIALSLLAILAAAPPPKEFKMSDAPVPAAPPASPVATPSIGEATMEPDGTIVLHLRAVSPTAIGDALLRYPPDHPQYKAILDHLGGLAPGEHKPVPPFD